ncbi:MAG: phosphate acyltransferase PlsX [Candidatus Omnitrophota bacterium]|nr:phosphate acyltransferase PlsX [Candidatus Omnitrophota bacterium]MDZ4241838.1 phosphate acyltransferase PlsX [Candidatus Omnitrophota bacterium]
MKIVVDAMGGDHAPAAVIAGVVDALKTYDINIALIGIKDRVEQELKAWKYPKDRIEVIHAPEVVEMHDPATASIRKKRNSSITLGLELIKDPAYNAFISAGNTGAVVAAATVNLGMIPGVERPAIGLTIPTLKDLAFLIDVGANTDPKPEHLMQWALMAGVYVREVMGVANPGIGLLNIGEEAVKGTDFVKDTHKLLSEHLPNFIGNIEANEVYTGKCECIICDGFVGNVVLKVSEGLAESATKLIKREVQKNPLAILGALLMKPALRNVKRISDYSEYGGAPLLGVKGIVMISHGRSSPKAIKNAIRKTMQEIEHNIIECMTREIGAKA